MQQVGQILRKARLAQNLTIEDIEHKTKIRKKNLLNIESSQWQNFSSSTYIIGIIRKYAQCVNLNPDTITAFFRREYETNIAINFKTRLPAYYLFPVKNKLALFLLIFTIAFFIIYLSYQLYLFVKIPTFSIIEPSKSTLVTREQMITFTLNTDKENIVLINNRRIFPDENRVFSTTVPFINEIATVHVEITGANGKKNSKIFIYKRKKP